jgi:hypothetical protein
MIRLTNRLFGTQPVVIHAPGAPYAGFQRLINSVCSAPLQKSRCEELTILTWNSGPRAEKPCGALERSLDRLGITPRVLGTDQQDWKNIDKLRLNSAALREVDTPYVLGADSCDVLFLDSPAAVLERFREHFTCDLVFNATGGRSWPDLPPFVAYESSRPPAAVAHGRHWLNSGVWIARTEFAREFFAALAASPPVAGFETSDQALIKREWPRWYPRVQLDYLSLMFQWGNEDRRVLDIARQPEVRQRQLLKILRPLGEKLIGAEVGVWDGMTSEALLRNFPQLELWMIDPWRPYGGESILGEQPQEGFDRARESALWWTDFAGQRRHVLAEASPSAAAHFADESLDFAFLDGNHLYESIQADIIAWWPKIKRGGLLTGHDYGVHRDAGGPWGVRRAVDEFTAALRISATVGDDGVWWVRK